MKIVLGSAQFGMDYGISNERGVVARSEVESILTFAKTVGIDTIDTAQNYGQAEQILGEVISNNALSFNIITKISFENAEKIEELLLLSLSRLKTNKLYGMLFHDFYDFLREPKSLDKLYEGRKRGRIEKVGFSLYYPKELEFLLENSYVFDVIQVPYSIFDRRFERFFIRLKEMGVEIYARSVFLQGLVFMAPDALSEHFKNIRPTIISLRNLAKEYNISLSSIALNYVMCNRYIDKVVIGIDSIQQLKKDLELLKEESLIKTIIHKIDKLQIHDENILLPFKWR